MELKQTKTDKGNLSEGCRGLVIIGLIIGVLFSIMLIFIFVNPNGLIRFGILANFDKLKNKLEIERTLPTEQYRELSGYLSAVREYARTSSLSLQEFRKIGLVYIAYRDALKDNLVSREDVSAIRQAVWKANMSNFKELKPENQTVPEPNKSRK